MTRRLAKVPVAEVTVRDPLREADPAWVEALAAMMAEDGQAQPIEVAEERGGYVLVFGQHRLLAAAVLRWKTIDALVDDEGGDLAARRRRAVLENLGHNDLNKLDRAVHIGELHTLEKAKRGERRGGNRRSPTAAPDQKPGVRVFGLTEEVANRVGLSDTVVSEAVKIAHGIGPAIRQRIFRSESLGKLANNQRDLVLLANEPDHCQTRILDLIEPAGATSVAEAIAILDGDPPIGAEERRFNAVCGSFSRLSTRARERFFQTYEREFLDWRQRKGRK